MKGGRDYYYDKWNISWTSVKHKYSVLVIMVTIKHRTGFIEVRVVLFLECFVDRCLSFCPLSLGHCVICPSSVGGL